MKRTLLILGFVLACLTSTFAQTKTNYELYGDLIKESVKQICAGAELNERTIYVDIRLTPGYETYSNMILSAFMKNAGKVSLEKTSAPDVVYNLTALKVDYGEVEKDGLFGSYSVKRKVSALGDFSITSSGKVTAVSEFKNESEDQFDYDDLEKVESPAFPFTQGNRPEVPFFSGLIEPAIVIGTAVVTIILFFSVRSG